MVQAPPPAVPVRDPKATPPRWLTKYGVGAWLVIGLALFTFAGGLLGAVIAIPILAVLWSVFKVLHKPDPPLDELPKEDPEELVGAKDD